MKGSTSLLPLLLLLVGLGTTKSPGANPPVRIMPLGDSITWGYSPDTTVQGGYRTELYVLLSNAGYNVDFVGTQRDTNPPPALGDADHEGHRPFFRIDQIDAGIDGWLAQIDDPDVVLVLIGTNDFTLDYDTAHATNRLENLIAHIATARPYAKIIVSNLILKTFDPTLDAAAQTLFNPYVPGIVAHQVSLGRQVYFVDLRSCCGASDLASDGVHPNLTGYDKIGQTWFPAVTSVISPLGTTNPPAIAHIDGQVDLRHVRVTFSKPVEDAAANSINYSLSGGVSVFQGELDAISKRIVTLTTSLQAVNTGYALTVSGVHDRTPQQSVIAPGTVVSFQSGSLLANGSFEQDYTGWVPTGNQVINSGSLGTDGVKCVAFNDGNRTPNGTLSQSFATTVGQAYTLAFDVGAYAYNHNEQRLQVRLQGSAVLLQQTVSVFGVGNGTAQFSAQSFNFVADSPSTTLTFTDVSTFTDAIDLMLDHVRVTAGVTAPVITSQPQGATVGVGSSVTFSVTASGSGLSYQWRKSQQNINGANASSYTINPVQVGDVGSYDVVVSNAGGLVTSNPAILTVQSAGSSLLTNGSFEQDYTGWVPAGNQVINSGSLGTDGVKCVAFNDGNRTPNGTLSQSFATTVGQAYTLAFDVGAYGFNHNEQRLQVQLQGNAVLLQQTVSVFGLGNGTVQFSGQSFNFVADSTSTTLTFTDVSTFTDSIDLMLDHVRVTTTSLTPPVITSQPQGATVTVGSSVTFSVTASGSGLSYQWRKNQQNITGANAGSYTINPVQARDAGSYDVVVSNAGGPVTSNPAILTVQSAGGSLLTNGSFEQDYTGWVPAGNQVINSGGLGTDGVKCVALNDGNRTPNGTLSQSFATTVGQAYTLAFDVGAYGFNHNEQRLQLKLQGSAVLLQQTVSVFGLGNGTVQFSGQSFNFVADSTSTTLTFTDVSTFTDSIDLMLDHVRVTASAGPALLSVGTERRPVSSLTTTLQGFKVRWTGISSGSYTIQRSEDLENWQAVAEVEPSADGVIEFDDQSSPVGAEFYRVMNSERLESK